MSTPEATIEHPNVSVKMEAQLPDELLLNIFGHLPQQSLRNARLFNNQWNAVSTPLVFERIHLSLISWSLAKVLALSQSPLAKHVKAIDFHTEKLYEIYHETYRKYSVDIRAPFFCRRNQPTSSNQVMHDCWKESKPRCHYTRDQLEAGWRAYETYRGESDRRIGLADCTLLLNDCLPKFRNLREVVADRIKRSGISRIDATAYWNNLKRTILINPFSRERHGDAIGTADGAVPTSVLLMALGNRSRVEGVAQVESLTIEMPGYSHLDFISYHRGFRRPSEHEEQFNSEDEWEAQCQVVIDVFKRLKNLALLCRGSRDMDKYELIEYRESEEEILRLLESATNLESLELEIGEGERVSSHAGHHEELRDSPVDLVLSSLFSSPYKIYPFLRELKIGASLHPESFINFLDQHKSTLRSLVMTDCIGYDWEKILDFVDQDLELDHFRAKFLWTRRLKTRDNDHCCHCIEFYSGYRYEDGDDRDWKDSWNDDELEMFQGKVLLFDVPLNKKMGLSHREFEDRFGSSRAASWNWRLKMSMFDRLDGHESLESF